MPPTAPDPPVDTTSEREELAIGALNLVPGVDVSDAGRIYGRKAETRKHIEELLGVEKTREILKKETSLNPTVIRDILDEIGSTRRGLYQYIRSEKPGEEVLNIGTPEQIKTLVRDPNSKEAQVLAWFYNMTGRTIPSAFEFVENRGEIRKMEGLSKLRDLYDALTSDPENFGIGDKGVITLGIPPKKGNPGTATVLKKGFGEIKKIQEQQVILHEQKRLGGLDTKAEIKELEDKIGELLGKRKNIALKLKDVERYAQQVLSATPVFKFSSIDNIARTFTKDLILTAAAAPGRLNATPVTINTMIADVNTNKTGTVRQWLTDDAHRKTLDGLMQNFRVSRGGKPRASAVLDQLIGEQYESATLGMDEAAKKAFIKEIKDTLIEGQAAAPTTPTPATAPGAPSTPPPPPKATSNESGAVVRGASKIWKYFWGKDTIDHL